MSGTRSKRSVPEVRRHQLDRPAALGGEVRQDGVEEGEVVAVRARHNAQDFQRPAE